MLIFFCKKDYGNKEAVNFGVEPKERSFVCKHLAMVKIRCSKDDARVHKLAGFFRSNGIPLEKIFIRRSGSTCESYTLFFHVPALLMLFYHFLPDLPILQH